MTPGSKFRGKCALASAILVTLGAAAFGGGPAGAVVGGQDEAGPLARQTVMVLSSGGGVCSGVVVAADAVLTAGHCVAGGREHRVHFKDGAGAPVLLEPAAIVRHPGYAADAAQRRRRSIDLALVRLAEPLPADFRAAALAGETVARGEAVTLAGYGLAREGDSRSSGGLRTASLVAVEPHGPSAILLWAAPAAGARAGACGGDSGGPMAGPDGAVAAVASWAAGGSSARCGEMSQGVLVAPQRAWIDATLAGWGRRAAWR